MREIKCDMCKKPITEYHEMIFMSIDIEYDLCGDCADKLTAALDDKYPVEPKENTYDKLMDWAKTKWYSDLKKFKVRVPANGFDDSGSFMYVNAISFVDHKGQNIGICGSSHESYEDLIKQIPCKE